MHVKNNLSPYFHNTNWEINHFSLTLADFKCWGNQFLPFDYQECACLHHFSHFCSVNIIPICISPIYISVYESMYCIFNTCLFLTLAHNTTVPCVCVCVFVFLSSLFLVSCRVGCTFFLTVHYSVLCLFYFNSTVLSITVIFLAHTPNLCLSKH